MKIEAIIEDIEHYLFKDQHLLNKQTSLLKEGSIQLKIMKYRGLVNDKFKLKTDDIHTLIEDAHSDYESFVACIELQRLHHGESDALNSFFMGILDGNIKRPNKPRGPSELDNAFRNLKFVLAVNRVIDKTELPKYNNSDDNAITACSVVKNLLEKHHIYCDVTKIYKEHHLVKWSGVQNKK